jgi:hypothetical protein
VRGRPPRADSKLVVRSSTRPEKRIGKISSRKSFERKGNSGDFSSVIRIKTDNGINRRAVKKFQVLIAVVVKSCIFSNITPSSAPEVNRRFVGT